MAAISGRSLGFRGPQFMAMAPWFANIAIWNGGSNETEDELVYHRGRYLEAPATAGEVESAVSAAAHFESGLHMAAYRADAFDI